MRPYLYGAKFVICTDHKPLKSLFSVRADMLSRVRLVLEGVAGRCRREV